MPADVDLPTLQRALEAREPRVIAEAKKRAAVATVLRPGAAGPEVLLIRRAEHPEDPWSGHMAFPGGRKDPDDADLLATAVRETREELGLDLGADAKLFGRLDDTEAIARARRIGMVISQFVFEVHEVPPLTPNREVAEALWAPIGPMITRSTATTKHFVHEGQNFELPSFDVEGRVVWGLTYYMLERLFSLLR
ncbi:MAG: CoA pyrophosphatase [Deltaproteobacteria bacterium]|nr:CoA pyrophosphatase [Deltaproteobacteria bacterium]